MNLKFLIVATAALAIAASPTDSTKKGKESNEVGLIATGAKIACAGALVYGTYKLCDHGVAAYRHNRLDPNGKVEYQPETRCQGQIGSCVSFAVSTAISHQLYKQGMGVLVSPLYLHKKGLQRIGRTDTLNRGNALETVLETAMEGFVAETLYPYKEAYKPWLWFFRSDQFSDVSDIPEKVAIAATAFKLESFQKLCSFTPGFWDWNCNLDRTIWNIMELIQQDVSVVTSFRNWRCLINPKLAISKCPEGHSVVGIGYSKEATGEELIHYHNSHGKSEPVLILVDRVKEFMKYAFIVGKINVDQSRLVTEVE